MRGCKSFYTAASLEMLNDKVDELCGSSQVSAYKKGLCSSLSVILCLRLVLWKGTVETLKILIFIGDILHLSLEWRRQALLAAGTQHPWSEGRWRRQSFPSGAGRCPLATAGQLEPGEGGKKPYSWHPGYNS